MKRALLLLILPAAAFGAQLSAPELSGAPGATVTGNVLYSAHGSLATGIQFDLQVDPTLTVTAELIPGQQKTGKSLSSAELTPGVRRYVVFGLDQSAMAEGGVIALTIKVPSSALAVYPLKLANLVATDKDGKSVPLTGVDGSISMASATSLPVVGSFPHFTSGGGWMTSWSIVNLGPASAKFRIRFYSDAGSEQALPLTSPQQGGVSGTVAELEGAVPAGGTVILQSEAAASQPAIVGWAELSGAAGLTGFAVFRYRYPETPIRDEEAVVPLETRSNTSFVVPSDNAAGFLTGIAVANPAASPVTVTAVALDDLGSTISTKSVVIPGRGHLSFVVPDLLPAALGKRGVIVVSVPSGSIAALAIRGNPYRSFTSAPAMVK